MVAAVKARVTKCDGNSRKVLDLGLAGLHEAASGEGTAFFLLMHEAALQMQVICDHFASFFCPMPVFREFLAYCDVLVALPRLIDWCVS